MGFERPETPENREKPGRSGFETTAERREKQALEIAAIVKDVIERDLWHVWDEGGRYATTNDHKTQEEILTGFTNYQNKLEDALLRALGRLAKSDAETLVEAFELLKRPPKLESMRGDPFVGLERGRSPFDDDDDHEGPLK